jgi:hypothetical protein
VSYYRDTIGTSPQRPPAEITLELAKKWAEIFGAPLSTIMAIVDIESAHNPKKINAAAYSKGGAWGYGQQMLDEGDYKVGVIKHKFAPHFPELSPILAVWKKKPKRRVDLGSVVHRSQLSDAEAKEFLSNVNALTAKGWYPENLLDPNLNLILTAWQLGELTNEFGDFGTVTAAYHQGAGAVRKRLDAGEPAVSKKQPKGLAYVAMAESARQKYLDLPQSMAIAD